MNNQSLHARYRALSEVSNLRFIDLVGLVEGKFNYYAMYPLQHCGTLECRKTTLRNIGIFPKKNKTLKRSSLTNVSCDILEENLEGEMTISYVDRLVSIFSVINSCS